MMKTVTFSNLPTGAIVRGELYDDPSHSYGLGDVLEIELPTGHTIDVGWDEDCPRDPFRIVVYREYFGDRVVDFRVREVDDVVREVEQLAKQYIQPCIASAHSQTLDFNSLWPAAGSLFRLAAHAASMGGGYVATAAASTTSGC
jgi:hypothetical protein